MATSKKERRGELNRRQEGFTAERVFPDGRTVEGRAFQADYQGGGAPVEIAIYQGGQLQGFLHVQEVGQLHEWLLEKGWLS